MGYGLIMPSPYKPAHSFHPIGSKRLGSIFLPTMFRNRIIVIVSPRLRLHWQRAASMSAILARRYVCVCFHGTTTLTRRARPPRRTPSCSGRNERLASASDSDRLQPKVTHSGNHQQQRRCSQSSTVSILVSIW